jgi:molybdopterin molybdotransferase
MYFEKALKVILKNTAVLPLEKVNIEHSINRVLGEDIHAGIAMPPFDKSAMDGYAVLAADTWGKAVILKNIGIIQAGDNFKKLLRTGECIKIMTGAALPPAADSVVMVEKTEPAGCDRVKILQGVKKYENVCRRGEDVEKGEKILSRGTLINPAHLSLIAAAGRAQIKAFGLPTVAILNTGGELVAPGKRIKGKQIYNSNGPMLSALLHREQYEPFSLGMVRDEMAELKAAIRKGLGFDILLISGAVSMGDYDLVPAVLQELGVRKVFHKIKVKPGKPLFFGLGKRTLVFGIPGNPVSNYLAYWLFIQPVLRKMSGYTEPLPEFLTGVMAEDYAKRSDRQQFVPVKILNKDRKYYLRPLPGHGSADVMTLALADGFMKVEPDTAILRKGQPIGFFTWQKI